MKDCSIPASTVSVSSPLPPSCTATWPSTRMWSCAAATPTVASCSRQGSCGFGVFLRMYRRAVLNFGLLNSFSSRDHVLLSSHQGRILADPGLFFLGQEFLKGLVHKNKRNSAIRRLDQGHLHPTPEVPRIIWPCRESNLGLRGGRRAP